MIIFHIWEILLGTTLVQQFRQPVSQSLSLDVQTKRYTTHTHTSFSFICIFFLLLFLSLWNMDDVMGAYRKKREQKCHKNFSTTQRSGREKRATSKAPNMRWKSNRIYMYLSGSAFSELARIIHPSAVHVLLIVCAQRWWQSSAIHLLQWHAHKTWSRIKWNVIRHKR